MTIIEIVDKANYSFFLKENAKERERERERKRERERERKREREKERNGLAKALTVLCLK